MQTASELKEKGVKRTKVTRDDGHVSESIESPALTRKMFPPEDGFTVTEIYGYDPELDGPPREPRGKGLSDLLVKLDEDELAELANTLYRGWGRADEVYPTTYTDTPLPNGGRDFQSHQNPIVWDLEKTHQPVWNERHARYLGCQWSACAVCRHESCVFCPACNPGEIAPNGDCYDADDGDDGE